MNPVQSFFAAMSDADLALAMAELQALDTTGVLPDGFVRKASRDLVTHAGIAYNEAAILMKVEPTRLAAARWLAGYQGAQAARNGGDDTTQLLAELTSRADELDGEITGGYTHPDADLLRAAIAKLTASQASKP